MKDSILGLGGLALLAMFPDRALAGRLSALVGPPSLGQGGSNPVSIPPSNPLDWQLSYTTDAGREWSLSVIPGLFYGQRFTVDQLTIGLGGGLLISTNGPGVGVFQSIGWETKPFWTHYRFEVEYRQVLGITAEGTEFPYAARVGVSYEL